MTSKRSLQHVLWVGGAPCAGKTTLSRRLSSDFDMLYYDGDDRFETHFETATAAEFPATCKAKNRVRKEGSSVWMFEQESGEMATFMRDLGREDLARVIKDLLELPSDKPIVVDLYSGHPLWVRDIATPESMVFLVSTDAFQKVGWEKRDGAFRREIEQCVNPEWSMKQFVDCCLMMSHQVRKECREYSLPLLTTGGCMELDEVYEAVCNHFGLVAENASA